MAFRALFRIMDAVWARPLSALAGAQASFLPAASVVLVVIVTGAGIAPWVPQPSGWLATPFLVLRQVLLNGALFTLAYRGLRQPAGAKPLTRRTAHSGSNGSPSLRGTARARSDVCVDRSVGKQQRIHAVVVRAELPRNPIGEVLKRELRRELTEGDVR